MAQEPVDRPGCFESDYPRVFHVPTPGRLSATLGDLEARGDALRRLDKAHILENGLDEKSMDQCSLTFPWGAL